MSFLLATLLCATVSARGPVPSIPTEFWPKNDKSGGPVWIDAAAVVSAKGELVEGRLAPADAIKLKYRLSKRLTHSDAQSAVESGGAPCDVAVGALVDDAPAHGSIQSLSAVKARAQRGRTISGTITATAVGFYSGAPFTMLEVTTENGAHTLYLLYPRGAIDVGGKRICTIDRRYAADPKLHDRVMAVLEEAVDARGHLYRIQPELLFFEKDGYTVMSGLLRGPNANSGRRFEALRDELLAIQTDGGSLR